MNHNNDTICAISTPHGTGGIAIARISGPEAITNVSRIWRGAALNKVNSHSAHLGTILDSHGNPLDQAVATVFRAPRSYTGEETIEISVHGSLWIQRELLASLCAAGCRMAEPGEFTSRAFMNGRLALTEAEAVADMIAASSRAAHRIAINHLRGGFSRRLDSLRDQLLQLASLIELELDFSEEEVEFASRVQLHKLAQELHNELTRLSGSFSTGAAIRQGIPVAIIGATNAGKSSLLNALVGDQRAIVSDIHGTTRDIVEDTAEIGDYLFRFLDTAGLRHTSDTIEQIGIERSRQAARNARIILLVCDATTTPDPDATATAAQNTDAHIILIANKSDLTPNGGCDFNAVADRLGAKIINISTLTGEGISELRDALVSAIDSENTSGSDLLVTNARHAQSLSEAADSISRVISGLDSGLSGDFIAQDIRQTIHALNELSGQITTPDILQNIFTRFCIGK
ncbi:MAG: tRNA uridine-5-carboxymethylaminomethyl(34) synthesis GTPase MnmE [Muribaculaceae bacterium]|nr:tRNA uridine-5-carboxymethylaminomethyl(34) synthesis GTPase MnmE [Muribaculaceae bacterium]MDE6331335.1 tRNA uridine-5-carboxymethylaminomethyl(34) synthesis GTPase MnmE [Muribaculaceae bacterium]